MSTRVRGLSREAHEAKNGGFRPESAFTTLGIADKTPTRLTEGELIEAQITVLVEKTQAEIRRQM